MLTDNSLAIKDCSSVTLLPICICTNYIVKSGYEQKSLEKGVLIILGKGRLKSSRTRDAYSKIVFYFSRAYSVFVCIAFSFRLSRHFS